MTFVDQVLDPKAAQVVSFAQFTDAVDSLAHRALAGTLNRARSDKFLDDVLFECHAARLGFSGELGLNLGLEVNLNHRSILSFRQYSVAREREEHHLWPQGGEEVHEAFDGESAGAVAHQGRDVRLFDAEDIPRLGLRQVAILDEAVNPKRKLCLQQLLLGMRKPEIRENVPAAPFHPDWFFRLLTSSHAISATR
jgi:hypothetical protein